MKYLVMYDLKDSKQSREINKLLAGAGHRVQDSVFECSLNAKEYDSLISELQIILQRGGNVRIYPVCRECMKKSVGIGDYYINPGNEGFLII